MPYPFVKTTITKADQKAIQKTLSTSTMVRGTYVAEFEHELVNYTDASYAVAFSSGTTALDATYRAANVGPTDRVITSPNTFVGTIAGAVNLGATITFADIHPETGNIDLDKLTLPTPSRGRLILVPVHYAGIPIDMARLDRQILDPHAIVIEDAAHAIGSTYEDGRRVGCCAYSDMTVFSFNPMKTITTGEGGAVMTNDKKLYERLIQIRDNGQGKEITGNFHLSEMGAALGTAQLSRIGEIVDKRKTLSARYAEHLPGISSHYLFVTLSDERDALADRLSQAGVETRVQYTPLYRHPSLKVEGEFPGCEKFAARALSLPLYPDLALDDIDKIVSMCKP